MIGKIEGASAKLRICRLALAGACGFEFEAEKDDYIDLLYLLSEAEKELQEAIESEEAEGSVRRELQGLGVRFPDKN